MATISEMFAEQEEDMARLNEIDQRENERHEKINSLMMMKEKMKKTPEPISPGISKDQLMDRRHLHELFKLNADDMFALEMLVDRDHDGKIDYAEFVDFVERSGEIPPVSPYY